jgi:ubiquitin-conjugating enzyme E2 S
MTKYPEGVKILINDEDPLDIQAEIEGPKGTPYENGLFRVKIIVFSDFPNTAPKGN